MSSEHLKLVSPHSGATDTLIGQVLDGRYEVERVLGEGGMGIVYKARHVTLGKPLAIKVLKAEVSKDQEIVQRFRQEAQSATAIGNHHIIDISDFGVLPDGSTFFVMEYLDGTSLTRAIEPGRPLKSQRTIHVAKQLCRALGAAHDVGIVHRDLKPDNIYLISRGGDRDFVKVLDFGIAKVGGKQSKLTQVGQVFGTPHYMSPEQCSGTGVDRRTDIYALGVIMYEMVTARVPFDADNLMGILTKHLYEQPIAPRDLPPPVEAPPALEAVIMKALAKKPELRYQTMQELLADLELVEQGLAPTAVAEPPRATSVTSASAGGVPRTTGVRSTTRSASSPPDVELPRNRSTGLVIGGALLVLVGVGAIFAFSGDRKETVVVDAPPAPAPEQPKVQAGSAATPAPVAATPEAEPAAQPTTSAPPPVPEAPLRVQLTSTPEGAQVHLNGALLGRTPYEIERPKRGEPELALTLKLAGYKDAFVRVSASTQERLALTLEREKRSAPAPRPRATPATPSAPPDKAQEEPKRPRPRPSTEVIDPWS